MCDTCDDSRFELIEKYKQKLLDATNIEDSPEEMAVIDNILFRFWQMGWLKGELFGNSEQLEASHEKDHVADPGKMVGDLVDRQATLDAVNSLIDRFERILSDIRESKIDDSVCGMCEYDGAFVGQSGDWCNECPGFEKDNCFKLSDECRKRWFDSVALPSAQSTMGQVNQGDTVNERAVKFLDLFAKTYCRDKSVTDDLKFRCSECKFEMPDKKCLVKCMARKLCQNYKDFGSMGGL